MKFHSRLFILMIAGLLGVACQSAHTQPSPQVIVVPESDTSQEAGMIAPAAPLPAPVGFRGAGRSYSACQVDGPYVAMTFDDGPHATLTPRLLDILKERGIRATFYVVGQNVAANSAIIQRAVAEGHEIGNHSWNHQSFTKIGQSGVASQINQTNEAIIQAGAPKPLTVRPPYGAINPTLTRFLNEEFGLKVVMWDVDPMDWKYRNSDRITSEILKNTKAGSIILAHDIHATTVSAMPATLDGLLKKGFQFVTVSELIAMDRPQPITQEAAQPNP